MRPRFSVVIPTHNSADSISRTIVGVMSQTFGGVEVLVVDAGSTDETLDVVDMLADERVRVISGPVERSGQSDTDAHRSGTSRALGFEHCTGRWATTIDPGDEVDPKWLARLGQLLDRSGASFITCGGTQRFTDMSSVTIAPIPVPEMDGIRACLRSGSFTAPATYFKKLPASRLDDIVTAGIAIIDMIVGDERELIATPEPLVHWTDEMTIDTDATDDERTLSRLMAALETLALAPIPDGELLARYAALGGEVAAGLGRRADARRLFAIARDTLPNVPRYWMEWAGSLLPIRVDQANG